MMVIWRDPWMMLMMMVIMVMVMIVKLKGGGDKHCSIDPHN
jgi:hypothetical protein